MPAPKKTIDAVPTTLEERVNSLIHRDTNMDREVHNVAVETLEHAATTGDYTLFARLIGDCHTTDKKVVFGRGVRSRRFALIEWATAFSPIRLNGDGLIGALKEGAKGYKPYNVEGAEAMPYYDMPAEQARRKANKPFDVAVILARLGSFTKAIDKAVESDTLNDDEEALRLLADEIQAFAIERAAAHGLSSDAAKARRAA